MTDETPTKTFPTREAAQSHIDELDAQIYYLAHGEHSRPTYTARKFRGENKYYVRAEYHYYAGTLHAQQSGKLKDH